MPDVLGPASSFNVTSTGITTVQNSLPGGVMIFLLVMVLGAIALIILISSLERFTAFFKMFDRLINSVRYTACGAGVVAALYGIYIACMFLASLGSGINPIHIGLGVAAYAGVTVLGYVAVKVGGRFGELYGKYRTQRGVVDPDAHIDPQGNLP